MNKLLALGCGILFATTSYSQNNWCGTTEKEEEYFNFFPERREIVKKNREDFERYAQSKTISRGTEVKNYIIPVVFHILHDNGPENLSDEIIHGQIEQLNIDFNAYNRDSSLVWDEFKSVIGNANIQFRLAQIDENLNSTSGIVRWETQDTYDPSSWQAAGGRIWDPSKYMNIFVMNCMDPTSCANNTAGGVAAYTYKPGTTGADIDAIYSRYPYVKKGDRTISHEVGHWLNLSHTWGDSNDPATGTNCSWDDYVDDTPNTDGQFGGCNRESTCGSLDNVQNIMNYANCSVMFTKGQVNRMRNALEGWAGDRSNLWSESNLLATGMNILYDVDFVNPTIVCQGEKVNFHDKSFLNDKNTWQWAFEGGNPSSSKAKDTVVTYKNEGLYDVSIIVSNGSTTLSKSKLNNIFVLREIGKPMPFSEGFESQISLNTSDWVTINRNEGSSKWELTDEASFNGGKSIKLENLNSDSANVDELLSNSIDLSPMQTASMTMRVAYAQVGTSNDKIEVWGYKNCGQDSIPLGAFYQGIQIAGSNSAQTEPFIPTEKGQWTKLTFNVVSSSYLAEDFIFKVKFESAGGNNIYIDDINFSGTYKSTPVLQSPRDGRVSIPDTVLLDWKAIQGVDEYYYELDTTNQFNSSLLQSGTLTYISDDPYGEDTQFEAENLLWGQKYYWRVRAYTSNIPSSWSDIWSFTVSNSGVGISENQQNLSLRVIPNPVTSSAMININSKESKEITYAVYNLLGQVELEKEVFMLNSGLTKINIDADILKDGIYFLVIDDGISTSSYKFIKN